MSKKDNFQKARAKSQKAKSRRKITIGTQNRGKNAKALE
jgi:hypothetical protein